MNVASACGAIVDVTFTAKVELQMWLFYKTEKKGGIAPTFPPHSGTEPPFHTRSILSTPSLESPQSYHTLSTLRLCTYFTGIDRLG
jgi:hypothetical protein